MGYSSNPNYTQPDPLQVLLLQLMAHLLWKCFVNRRYYVLRNQMRVQKAKADAGSGPQPSPPPSPPPLVLALPPRSSAAAADDDDDAAADDDDDADADADAGRSGAGSGEGILGRRQRTPAFEQGRVLAAEPPQPPEPRMEPSPSRPPRSRLRALSKTAARLGKPLPKQLTAARARGEAQQRPASRQAKSEEAEAESLKARFRPFPSYLRWPTAPCFACICCMSGLLQGSTAILVAHKTASRRAVAVATAAAAIAVGVLLLLWAQLVVFARRHAHLMWAPTPAPTAPSEVRDPALRLVSTIRRRILTHISQQRVSRSISRRSTRRIEQNPALDRMKGAFTTHGHREHENTEPERTERLLANPVALLPPTASDAYESVAVTVLYKSRGDRKHALAYHLGRLSVQVRHTPARQTAHYACTCTHARANASWARMCVHQTSPPILTTDAHRLPRGHRCLGDRW